MIIISRWYEYQGQDSLYVHTNYNSFMSSMGGFGDRSVDYLSKIKEAISKQEQRERELEKILQTIFGSNVTLKTFQETIQNYLDIMSGKIEAEWINEIIETPQGKKNTKNFVINGDIDHALRNFNDYTYAHGNVDILNSLLENVDQSMKHSLSQNNFTLENWEDTKKRVESDIKKIKQRAGVNDEEGLIVGASTQAINNIKGSLFELYGAKFIIAALQSLGEGLPKDSKIVLQGSKNVADIRVDLSGFSFGVSMKATKLETFMKSFGIRLFSSSIEQVFNRIKGVYPDVNWLKYYIINIIRGRSLKMTDQSGGINLKTDASAYKAIDSVFKAYATIYLGDQNDNLLVDDSDANDFKQSDIFFTQEKIYLKSEILKNLETKDMMSFLAIDQKSDYDFETFDYNKVWNIFFAKQYSDKSSQEVYKALETHPIMTSAVSALLKVNMAIRLRLL